MKYRPSGDDLHVTESGPPFLERGLVGGALGSEKLD